MYRSLFIVCMAMCMRHVNGARRVINQAALTSNKTGAVDVTILTVYHGRTNSWGLFGGANHYSQIIANTFSFNGGPGTGSDFRATGSCSESSWTTSNSKLSGVKITGGFVQTQGSDRVRVYTNDGQYRKFNPGYGAYTPFGAVNVNNPPNFEKVHTPHGAVSLSKLVADAVASGEGSRTGVLSLQGDEFSHVNTETGSVEQACSYPGIADYVRPEGWTKRLFKGEVHVASAPSEKAVVVGKNYRESARRNELYVLDTDRSGGECQTKSSWKLQEGEWFCGIAVDQARKKIYALVEHHKGSKREAVGRIAETAACGNSTWTVDRLSMYEISLQGGGELQGERIYDLPDFDTLAKSDNAYSETVLHGRPTMFYQSKSIWFLQMGHLVYPIEVANRDKMPSVEELRDRSFECSIKDLYSLELPPTIWAEGR